MSLETPNKLHSAASALVNVDVGTPADSTIELVCAQNVVSVAFDGLQPFPTELWRMVNLIAPEQAVIVPCAEWSENVSNCSIGNPPNSAYAGATPADIVTTLEIDTAVGAGVERIMMGVLVYEIPAIG